MKKRKINILISKFLLSIILFLLFIIGHRKINGFDNLIYEKVYNNSFSFAKINSWYQSHFGNLFPIKSIDEVQVFNESISYIDKNPYLDGVLLNVSDNYIVPSITNGIVIYIGNKDKYGSVIIVEDEKGIDTWYCNINIGNINMYDYIKNGDYLGEAIDNKLILVFQKNGEVEDYNKYI